MNEDSDEIKDSIRSKSKLVLPLEILDKSINSKIRILMTSNKEFVGTLVGFDDYVNIVLKDVQEIDEQNKEENLIKNMLLGGGNIAMIKPVSMEKNFIDEMEM